MFNHRVCALVVLLLGSQRAFARVPVQSEPEPEPEAPAVAPKPKPWLLAFALTHEQFTGDDFDDSHVLVEQTPGYAPAFVAIPQLNAGTGFTLGLGYGAYPEKKGDLGFWTGLAYSVKWMVPSSVHTASAPEAVLHDLNFPFRVGYRANHGWIPYAQVSYGFGFLSITGVHGYLDESAAPVFDDEPSLFLGRSFGFGIGNLFPISETLFIDAFMGYSASFITSVDGAELDDSLDAGVLTLNLGPTFLF